MEVLNSASTGAMGSLLCKLEELLRRTTEDDEAQAMRQLRDDVASIGLKLEEVSEVHDPPLALNYWMRDARELSYDMEDCVDLFVDEISGFRTRVEEVMERYHRFNLESVVLISSRPDLVANTEASHRLQTATEDAPIGMEGPKTELARWLKPKDDDDNGEDVQLKVVSILGVEGVGKSTLAQELWRILGEEFECRAFVQASKKPNMRMILRSILLQVRPNQQPPEVCRVPNLIRNITKHLHDKRYFIILDDLWAVSVWDTVSRAFPEGNCCSRIVTTTTIKDVALACCSYNLEHIFKMKSLSHDQSIGLFTRTVFGSGKECPQKFHDVSDEITGKCGGLPLAITCIATLVASQQDNWEYIQKFLHQNLRTNPTSVEILKQVLNLCYSSLPRCLKTCLLYLSVYPENYLILKEDLVKQWIAEGFVCAKEQKDIASRYFDQLVSLGLIQRMDISCDKKGLPYVVHPTVFEFITCKSIEDNFITIIDYSQSTIALTEKVRRLSLHFGSATYATISENIRPLQIRSLSFMGLLNCMPSLEDFKLVRVIILHVLVDIGDTSFSLTGIRGLLLLRYLQVRCNVTVELPDQIGCLKHLETLEIHGRVVAVPSDIVNLPRLRYLLRTGRKKHCHHKHLTPSCLPSVQSLSLHESRWESYVLMIPRSPQWIGHFRFLFHLDVAVGELQMYGVDVLAELLWALKVLSLYVGTPTAGAIHFKRGAFQALNYFRYMCGGVMLLTFDKEAMPNLWKLNIGFNAHRGVKYGHMLAGIQHLLNLQEISACVGAAFGAEESDRRAVESAFRDAISKHPCLPSFKVKRFDRVDGEYDPFEKKNWVQEMDLSNEREDVVKIQHAAADKEDLSNNALARVLGKVEVEDHLSNDQPAGVLEKVKVEDHLSNDQPAVVLGKKPWEDDLSDDQPAVLGFAKKKKPAALGKMKVEDHLSNDQPAGVLGKRPWKVEDHLSNDQPAGVLGKRPWEDDLSDDQPAVLGKMKVEDHLSNDQTGNMQGGYMNKNDAYARVMRLASERAVVVFTMTSNCCMCHTVTTLMTELGVDVLVHELDRDPRGREMERTLRKMFGRNSGPSTPAVFIGGLLVGGTERIMSLHLDGKLLPMIRKSRELWALAR